MNSEKTCKGMPMPEKVQYYGGHEWDACFLCGRLIPDGYWHVFSWEWDAFVHVECPWSGDNIEYNITAREFGWDERPLTKEEEDWLHGS